MSHIRLTSVILLLTLVFSVSCSKTNPFLGKDISEIIIGFESPDSEDRENAARALESLGPEAESAIPELTEALFDSDSKVRFAARDAMVSIGSKAVEPMFIALWDAILNGYTDAIISNIRAGLFSFDTNAISGFAEYYFRQAADSTERYTVILVLSSMIEKYGEKAVDSAPVLVSALDDSYQPTQLEASKALVALGKNAVPELMKGLESQSTEIRYQSTVVLGRIGPRAIDAATILTQTLNDPDPTMRAAARLALERIGIPIAITPNAGQRIEELIETLKDPDPFVREATARALGDYGPTASAALPSLRFLSEDPNEAVRIAAQEAIVKIETP